MRYVNVISMGSFNRPNIVSSRVVIFEGKMHEKEVRNAGIGFNRDSLE